MLNKNHNTIQTNLHKSTTGEHLRFFQHVPLAARWCLGSLNMFLMWNVSFSQEINLLLASLWADKLIAKYSCYLFTGKQLFTQSRKKPKAKNRLFDPFHPLGIIFNICFCLCQDLLTLQTVPFHYLHAVLPRQVSLNVSHQRSTKSSPSEKLKLKSLFVLSGKGFTVIM